MATNPMTLTLQNIQKAALSLFTTSSNIRNELSLPKHLYRLYEHWLIIKMEASSNMFLIYFKNDQNTFNCPKTTSTYFTK